MQFLICSLPTQLVLLLGAAQTTWAATSSAGKMAAWFTTIGPQILVQNLTTGGIMYSSCNSYTTPIFPNDPPNLLSLTYQPRNGTAVAGTGWWDNTKTTTSMFYQAQNGDLINSLFYCDMDTGKFENQGSWVISDGVPQVDDQQSISNETGLASLVLGDTEGYRVYYHDANMHIHEISYTTETNWHYSGGVSQAPAFSRAIHAQFTGSGNISVASPKDAQNIEVSRLNSDKTWHLSTFPRPLTSSLVTNKTNSTSITLDTDANVNFTLPAWDGTAGSLGVAIDHAFTRSVYYIGTDRALYQASNVNFVWRLMANQSRAQWPLADVPNADFALASDYASSEVRVYYYVSDRITEVNFDGDGSWKTAAALAVKNTTAKPTTSPTASPSSSAGASSGLSTGAKAGIGVGVSLGVIAIAGLLGVWLCLRRRMRHAHPQATMSPHAPGALAAAGAGGAGGQYQDYASTPYGSPPQQSVSPSQYTDYTNSAYGQPQMQQQWTGDNKQGYPAGYQYPYAVQTPPPQELEGPRPMYEMADQHYSHELVGDSQRTEMPANEVRR